MIANSIILYYIHLSFFLFRHDLHRDLHSFPTRRSSDLDFERGRPPEIDGILTAVQAFARAAGVATPHLDAVTALRSEEHTSELQSRGHLVCRLLLEKKKSHQQRGSRYLQ